MISCVYRLTMPVTVEVQQAGHYRLTQLPVGSIFVPRIQGPDRNGIVYGTCKGDVVLLFSRDLENCAEPIAGELPHALATTA